ncbi:DUF1674 domain-containing protein [Solilutibacter oculi]|uniref:DUF1674 domain-containing protein n=1 Tax=Solilutibacter oculi TaxID=2698682 RepID=UPI001F3E15AE|nr:DUF1674 domain-containing protein [Lysobacter oculi]
MKKSILGETVPEPASPAEADPRNDTEQRPDTAPVEVGGRKGPDPTRYGDWEKNGRCIDF